jgi:hypothetical protein
MIWGGCGRIPTSRSVADIFRLGPTLVLKKFCTHRDQPITCDVNHGPLLGHAREGDHQIANEAIPVTFRIMFPLGAASFGVLKSRSLSRLGDL